jgi:hypothetical protein
MNPHLLPGLAFVAAVLPYPCGAQGTSRDVAQAGYSAQPLQRPLFDEAQVLVEATAINNWLGQNIQQLSYAQMKGPREHLYYLIDSRVKHLYAAEKQILPRKGDPILEILFSWSEHLGVFGGALAYNAVKAPTSPAKAPAMKLPAGIELALNKDLFTLRSDLGWSIIFPYYFMIWNVGDFTAKGGPRTQLVALSTGAAKDSSQAGRSQGTLMFLFSPEKNFVSFESYWLGQMGIDRTAKAKSLGIRTLQSRHIVDDAMKLHKEFTAWPESSGSYAVAYLGIEGTYEWNRPHFLDFMRVMNSTTKPGPNSALHSDGERGR